MRREGESSDVGVEDLNNMSVEPIPTYAEVLRAVSIINRYIGHIGDPAMHKFEADLASFARKMQSERSNALRMHPTSWIISTSISNQRCLRS
jgi:hypothetical protein